MQVFTDNPGSKTISHYNVNICNARNCTQATRNMNKLKLEQDYRRLGVISYQNVLESFLTAKLPKSEYLSCAFTVAYKRIPLQCDLLLQLYTNGPSVCNRTAASLYVCNVLRNHHCYIAILETCVGLIVTRAYITGFFFYNLLNLREFTLPSLS